jgi:hypothetical protein
VATALIWALARRNLGQKPFKAAPPRPGLAQRIRPSSKSMTIVLWRLDKLMTSGQLN